MKAVETKIRGRSQVQLINMSQNNNKLERDKRASALIDEYVAFAGKKEFRDLIIGMSYLEVIYDTSRQRKIACND